MRTLSLLHMVDLVTVPHIRSELSEVLWQQILHFGYTLSVGDLPVWLTTVLQIIVVFGGFAGWAGTCVECFLHSVSTASGWVWYYDATCSPYFSGYHWCAIGDGGPLCLPPHSSSSLVRQAND